MMPGLAAVVVCWVAVEIVFWVLCRRGARLQQVRQALHAGGQQPLPSEDQLASIATPLLDYLRCPQAVDIRRFFSAWFQGAPFASVRLGNVLELFSAAYCGSSFKDLPAGHRAIAQDFMDVLQKGQGIRLTPGLDPSLRLIPWFGVGLAPIHKPLLVYAMLFLANFLTRLVLCCLGFRRQRMPNTAGSGLPFWTQPKHCLQVACARRNGSCRAGQGAGRDGGCVLQPPCLFLPGVGVGLVQYLPLLWRLAAGLRGANLIIVELPSVAAGLLFESPQSVDDCARGVLKILGWLGLEESVCVIAHSYGTFVLARMLQLQQEAVCGAVLLEATSLLPFYPSPAGPVQIVKRPTLAALWRAPCPTLNAAMRYLCVRDYCVSQAMCSAMMPFAHIALWPSQLPANSVVLLAEKDDLTPVPEAVRLLRASKHPCQVLIIPGASHGYLLHSGYWQRKAVEAAAAVVARSQECVEGSQSRMRGAKH